MGHPPVGICDSASQNLHPLGKDARRVGHPRGFIASVPYNQKTLYGCHSGADCCGYAGAGGGGQARRGFARARAAAERHVPRGFRRALEAKSREGVAVIAELKKASPSKGLIRADFRPAELARELEAAGAAALSVLTDEEFFQGSLGNLREASAAVAIPCLRKDFIVDEFQLVEARANCGGCGAADCGGAVDGDELSSLARGAREGGAGCFV